MNVDHIYQLQRDDAFAAQFSATKYQTFVAMPFSNRGGYPEARIRTLLLEKVHERANALRPAPPASRTFAPLQRVDGGSGGAVVITDQIATDILACHFFLADLTGSNFGVVLETGIALALKPNGRVLLFTQDDSASLHFDLRVTNVNRYTEDDLVEKVASALVGAAEVFENEADRYIRFLSSQLTSDAILVLNHYGQRWKGWCPGKLKPSIFYRIVEKVKNFSGLAGRVAFHDAVRELSARRLFWTDYKPNASPGADHFGFHATKLGWRVIEHLWQHDSQMREPRDAPTGPNLN
jgi:hypothetical protein